MQRKDKLAKLLEKSSVSQPINYEVLEKAKRNTNWDQMTNDGRIKNLWQNKILLMIVASIVFVLAVIGISLGIILPKQNNLELLPNIKFYQYNEDDVILYESINQFVDNNDIAFEYFKDFNNCEEDVKVYLDNNNKVLVNQHIFNPESLETIILYVELKENYIFEYDKLENTIVLNNTEINYSTNYNQLTYSYVTHAKFKYKDKIYRVSFDLIEEDGWKTYLQQLIK